MTEAKEIMEGDERSPERRRKVRKAIVYRVAALVGAGLLVLSGALGVPVEDVSWA